MGKTFGQMTPAEQYAATKRAAGQLQAELQANAAAIGRVLDGPLIKRIDISNAHYRGEGDDWKIDVAYVNGKHVSGRGNWAYVERFIAQAREAK